MSGASVPGIRIWLESTTRRSFAVELCANVRAQDGSFTILAITHRPAWVEVADRLYEVTPGGVRLVTETMPARTALLSR
jgi:ABC-type siderophore export system fused ATPase/permease subunit